MSACRTGQESAAPTTITRPAEHLSWSEPTLAALNARLFAGRPDVLLLNRDNEGVATVPGLAAAAEAVAERPQVATVAAWLHPSARGVDIDPGPGQAEAGEAAAEQIRDWCAAHGVPYALVNSGRPGGRHVFAVLADEQLREQWPQVCTAAGEHHQVPVDVRDVFRLLGAPHRHGLPAGLLDLTVSPDDLPDPAGPATRHDDPVDGRPRAQRRADPLPTPLPPPRRISARGTPSEDAFGDTCAMIRAGYTVEQAWAEIGDCKVVRRGYQDFRRYLYLPARIVVDAERDVDEDQAWRHACVADPQTTTRRGRGWWHGQWIKARDAARDPQQRRRPWTPPGETGPDQARRSAVDGRTAEQRAADRALVHRYRVALRIGVLEDAARTGVRADAVNSRLAMVDALAVALVRRDGALSQRTWSVQACLSRATITRHLPALQGGLINRVGQYEGGATDSDTWALGPLTQGILARLALSETTSTSGTPLPPSQAHTGRSDPTELAHRYARERALWRARCAAVAAADAAGVRLAACTDRAARNSRSLWHQRRWWTNLAPDQRQERIEHRRRVCAQLSPIERKTWFNWLACRDLYAAASERLTAATGPAAGSDAHSVDHDYLAGAPLTLHRGLRDPAWRTGGSRIRPRPGRQLTLTEAAA